MKLYGGVEGGASSTIVSVFNGKGTCLVQVSANVGSNVALIGPKKVSKIIFDLFEAAERKKPALRGKPLACIGLGLAGAQYLGLPACMIHTNKKFKTLEYIARNEIQVPKC